MRHAQKSSVTRLKKYVGKNFIRASTHILTFENTDKLTAFDDKCVKLYEILIYS